MRKILIILAVVLVALGGLYTVYEKRAERALVISGERALMISTMFTGAEQLDNFYRMPDFFPTSTLTASNKPHVWQMGETITLPAGFDYEGTYTSTEDFFEETDTAALLVLKDGIVRYEAYYRTGAQDRVWMSMSVAKSFISALVGIAQADGLISDISDPITDYLPYLKGSSFDNVPIKDLLQMSSGTAWDETYGKTDSDVSRFGRIFALGGSLTDFLPTLTRESAPGTVFHYNSSETQVLSTLLAKVTGKTVTAYMQEKLWTPLGASYDAYWLLDDDEVEMAFGGLNATARDYARLGELYRQNGNWQGKQIVPARWVADSVRADKRHLTAAGNASSGYRMGYGYQWWLMDGTRGDYSAIGVYNQNIYVDPKSGVVIVKLSANSDYATPADPDKRSKYKSTNFFRAIVEQF